jgi:hypothetical protein
MDEQRIQAYLDLINQLLCCPDGQEPEILQAHRELLDPDLLQVMVQVAEQLQQQGNETNAAWLQNLVMQLAETMDSTQSAQLQSSSTFQDRFRFLGEIFQCISQNQGAIEPVYQFLEAHQPELDMHLVNVLSVFTSAFFLPTKAMRKV